jgi:hypothetical protein
MEHRPGAKRRRVSCHDPKAGTRQASFRPSSPTSEPASGVIP